MQRGETKICLGWETCSPRGQTALQTWGQPPSGPLGLGPAPVHSIELQDSRLSPVCLENGEQRIWLRARERWRNQSLFPWNPEARLSSARVVSGG